MKSTVLVAALAVGVAACIDAAGPVALSTDVAESDATLAGQPDVAQSGTEYGRAAAKVVLDDLLTRLLPTLTSVAAREALHHRMNAVSAALVGSDDVAVRDYVDAAKESLKAYGKIAPSAEQPELEAAEFALDSVKEGVSPRAERGREQGGDGAEGTPERAVS